MGNNVGDGLDCLEERVHDRVPVRLRADEVLGTTAVLLFAFTETPIPKTLLKCITRQKKAPARKPYFLFVQNNWYQNANGGK